MNVTLNEIFFVFLVFNEDRDIRVTASTDDIISIIAIHFLVFQFFLYRQGIKLTNSYVEKSEAILFQVLNELFICTAGK